MKQEKQVSEMNPLLKEVLVKNNIKVLNPVWDSLKRQYIVGWYVQAPSVLRYEHCVTVVKKFLKEKHLDYYLNLDQDNIFDKRFIIYEKKHVGV